MIGFGEQAHVARGILVTVIQVLDNSGDLTLETTTVADCLSVATDV